METRPDNLKYLGFPFPAVMSNLDHTINEEVEQLLRAGDCYADYPAWNFHGAVWFDGKFKCQIKRYHSHIATLEAETLQEIMDEASDRWGAA